MAHLCQVVVGFCFLFSVSVYVSELNEILTRSNFLFNASRDRGQAIHLLSEEAKQLLHPVTGLREAVRSMQMDGQSGWGRQLSATSRHIYCDKHHFHVIPQN
jgi:hypothetical protein